MSDRSTSFDISRPERALRQIRSLRYRRRRIRAVDGFARLIVVAVIVIWSMFLLDWSLDLPLAVRGINAVAAVTFLILALRVFLLASRRRVSDSWLAAQIEAASELDQSLVTAVQLADPDNPRRALYSPVLLERTVQEAEERIEHIRVSGLVSPRGLVTTFVVLIALLAPLVIGAAIRTDLASTFVKRDLLFQRLAWPRSYLLEIEEPVEARSLIAMGDPLSIVVHKVRGGDARVNLEVTFDDGSRDQFALEKKGENRYRKVFPNVTRDFEFRLRCGDFKSEYYTVVVRNRPRVQEITLEFDYPDYTGLDQLAADGATTERNLGGHLKVPVGTKVMYSAKTSIPVSNATWIEEYQAGGEAQATRVELDVSLAGELSGSFVAQRNGTYHFELTSQDGFRNPSPIRYRVAVVPDQPPIVQLLKPGRNTEVSLRAQFAIDMIATDDFGLTAGRLVFASDDGTAEGDGELPIVASIDLEAMSGGAIKAEPSHLVDLEPFGLQEGQRVQYHAEAEDALGQVGPSRKYVLTIVAEDELMRILQDELSLVRESLEQCLEWQGESRDEIEDVVDATIAGSSVREADLPSLRHARLTQERVDERLAESVARVSEIIDRAQENRLVWKELPRVESVRDRLREISETMSPPALAGLNLIVRKAEEGTRDEVIAALDHQRRLERSLRDLLVDLREWGDLRSLIRKVEELIGTQRQLEDHVKSKVKDSLDSGGGDRR